MIHASRVAHTLVVLFGLAAMTAPTMQAQTPATTVKDSDENVVFQSNADGGLLAPGTFGTGTIPVEGAGMRLMWYPAKGAFRAGRVGIIEDGTQWDAGKVGFYSVAFGADTKASGNVAMAMGDRTIASGESAVAMGEKTTASSDHATAMGLRTEASAYAATAMGDRTTASGTQAAAIGERTTASGNWSTAMGERTTASGDGATAMGRFTTAATEQSLSIGECNSANMYADNTLFVVGNGAYQDFSCDSNSDALVLDQSGNLTISGSLTQNSDRRLKTAIEPLGDGTLGKLADLRPVRYAFKNQTTHPSGEQIGLVAQDVQKEFPQLVSEGSGGTLSLAYPKLTAVLLKGLQEQQSTIDSLKTRIRSLQTVKKRQARLAEQVAALQQDRAGVLPAGWGASALLALLLTLGGVGLGLLWRRTGP